MDSNATIGLFWSTALCTSWDTVKEKDRPFVIERDLLVPIRAGNNRKGALPGKCFARIAPRHPNRVGANFAKCILMAFARFSSRSKVNLQSPLLNFGESCAPRMVVEGDRGDSGEKKKKKKKKRRMREEDMLNNTTTQHFNLLGI